MFVTYVREIGMECGSVSYVSTLQHIVCFSQDGGFVLYFHWVW